MEHYKPEIVESRYALFLVRLDRCVECKRFMVVRPRNARDTFPYYHKLDFDAQAKAGNLGIKSGSLVDNSPICEDCEAAGKARFVCALCKKMKSSDKIQRQVGDPAEYLCADCYQTVPAEKWDESLKELIEDHKWDYE